MGNEYDDCDYLKAEIERLKEKVAYLQTEIKALKVNLGAAENENDNLRMKIVKLVANLHQ